jgi:2-hydroxychromene-2-carboxylate isomerase
VYIWKDVIRTAHALGVPIAPPPAHPFNPLLALRCASLVDPHDGGERKRAIDALYQATWGGGGGIETPDAVAAALSRAGLDGAALVARASTDDAKARVKAQTTRALDLGVFGVPSLLVDGELFWGFDSYPHIERRLRGDDPVDRTNLAQWANLPSSSVRKAVR